jgi:hypothetical protein
MDYGLDGRGSITGRGKTFVQSVQTSSGAPHSLLSNGCRRLFTRGQRGRVVKLTTHLQLCRGQEYVDLYIHSPIRLHGVMLN